MTLRLLLVAAIAWLATLVAASLLVDPPQRIAPTPTAAPTPAATIAIQQSSSLKIVRAVPTAHAESPPVALTPIRLATPAPAPPLGWVQAARDTELLSAPQEEAPGFGTLPGASYLKVLQAQPSWLLIVYGGGETIGPGSAWVRAADVAPPSRAPQWVRTYQETLLQSRVDAAKPGGIMLPVWSWLEVVEPEKSGLLRVRYPGDGRTRLAGEAWVAAKDVVPVLPPPGNAIPRAYPAILGPGVLRLQVPYRSQLDGAPWEASNCGPATLGMALESFGSAVSSTQLREEVLDAQQIWGDDAGTLMEALVSVGEQHGGRVMDFLADGQRKHWALDDIRGHLRAGHPVIVQVLFRALPEREESPYWGDHYIVITGLIGENFLYDDSVDKDGIGYDRILSPAQLEEAMNAGDRRYAYAGFALARQ